MSQKLAQQYLAKAQELLSQKKLQAAMEQAQLAQQQGAKESRRLMAYILRANGQYDDACRNLSIYSKAVPDDLEARLSHAEMLSLLQRPRLFNTALKEATSLAEGITSAADNLLLLNRLRALYEKEKRPLPSWLAPDTRPLSLPVVPKEEPRPTLAPIVLPSLLIRTENVEASLPSYQAGPYHTLRAYQLRQLAEELSLVEGYDELLCIPTLRGVEEMWHQVEAARKVLRQLRGTALLADEVGLGKTIEASMIVKELVLRGMARKILILCPPSLVSQWQGELEAKFELSFQTADEAKTHDFWAKTERVIASLALARRPPHKDLLAQIEYDVIVVDEAHHLKNRTSASWKLLDTLKRRFLLLLTATPVENELEELYNLITLLRPGQLGTPAQFRERFIKKGDPRTPVDRDKLRALLRDVMIRNTRASVGLKLPPRQASTVVVEPSPEELALYQGISTLVREAYPLTLITAQGTKEATPDRLTLQVLLAEAGSSAAATIDTLAKISARPWARSFQKKLKHLSTLAEAAKRSTKAEKVLAIARATREPMLCFTQFRKTLALLQQILIDGGIKVAAFHGDLSRQEKDDATARFLAGDCQVLLSTEVGGEGKNLQRACAHLVNVDAPWNPMRIEQRIGRLHRIGQQKSVRITTLVSRDSIEEKILTVLHDKINLFELVVGEVDLILGRLSSERDFAEEVLARWAEARDEEAAAAAFETLGEELSQARRAQLDSQKLDDAIFGQDYES